MAKRNTHHVVPNSKGGWDVKKGGAQRASGHFDTKKEAEAAGREISRNQGTEFVIHGKDGVIRRSDSHGHDPNPPKDNDSKKDITVRAFQQAYDSQRDKKH
jgi:hypothetical protein